MGVSNYKDKRAFALRLVVDTMDKPPTAIDQN